MLLSQLINRIYWREVAIVRRIKPWIVNTGTVLDLGAGGCKLASLLNSNDQLCVTAIDVVDHNVTELPLIIYDGDTLPFPSDEFDQVLLVFVLHHAARPLNLLREASRVSRGRVLVVEDTPRNALERKMWRWFDDLLNHHVHSDIAVADQAGTIEQWAQLFRQAGLVERRRASFRTFLPVIASYRHTLFSLSREDVRG